MVEKVIETFTGACRRAKSEWFRFIYAIEAYGMPPLSISLPFTIEVRCKNDDIYVTISDRESEVVFTWKVIYYRKYGGSETTELHLTLMDLLDILLLHYLDKYGGVLTKILEFVKEHSQEVVMHCRELVNVISSAKIML